MSRRKVKRKSRDEKLADNFTIRAIHKVDKQRRTRNAKKVFKQVEETLGKEDLRLQDLQPFLKGGPPRKLKGSGEKLYSGKGRSFRQEFQEEWWAQRKKPWICHICGKEIYPKGKGGKKPTIDHYVPWSEFKLSIATFKVCKDGQHWEVALTEEVRAALEDSNNLRPAHQSCNSSKGGRTDTDSLGPQRREKCPGKNCAALDAE